MAVKQLPTMMKSAGLTNPWASIISKAPVMLASTWLNRTKGSKPMCTMDE